MAAKRELVINKDRVDLGAVAPVDTPFGITMGVSEFCNLKCSFCGVNAPGTENRVREMMSLDLFKKIIDDVKQFNGKVKALTIAGNGEPLTNNKITQMIKYASDAEIFDKIEIITNGTILNPKLNLELIDAGLTHLKVSLEAIDDETFEKIAGVKIDVSKLTENIKHFYENRRNCNVYIKTVDIAVETQEKKNEFFRRYETMCDNIYIENIVDLYNDYDQKEEKIIHGKSENIPKGCAFLYKTTVILTTGEVLACCAYIPEYMLGNVKHESIVDIWNGEKMRQMRINQLTNPGEACKICNPANHAPFDNIDAHLDGILERLKSVGAKE